MNKCAICNECYLKASSLSDHLAKVHKFSPTFTCKNCGHNSPSMLALQKHQKSHLNEIEIINEENQMNIGENEHFTNNQVVNQIISKNYFILF